MSNKYSVSIEIGNIIPHGNARHTGETIALWRELGKLADPFDFTAAVPGKNSGRLLVCRVSIQVEEAIAILESARDKCGSFDDYRLEHVKDASLPVAATLPIEVESADPLTMLQAYGVATILLQQIVLAMNIALPGSVQMLDTAFRGDDSHQVEAPVFDAVVFFGARNALDAHHWPELTPQSLEAVWRWLEKCEVSATLTAIKGINKALFTLLKIAEQRRDYSARTVLMVVYLLEVLMDSRNAQTFKPVRNRISRVLGNIPESADCIKDLYHVRASLFEGDLPVSRPALIQHSARDELTEQLDQHDNMVELGVLMAIALLQDLVSEQALGYAFTESFTRLS